MKMKKILAVILSAVMVTSVLAGCGKKDDSSQGSDNGGDKGEVSTEMADEQVLNLRFLEPTTLDVNDLRNASESQILTQVQEGLFRVMTDEEGNDKIELAGAESYEISDDNLVYTFKIRDHKWSDGVAVTAQHYVDSIIRLLDAEMAFSYAFMGYDIKNGEAYYKGETTADQVGVKAVDEKTLEITLEQETPYFLKKLSYVCFFPIRLDVIEKGGETWKTDYTAQVFNGPFVITDWVRENSMTLVKNESYWDAENVHLTQVNMNAIEETATRSLMFESKELDVVTGEAEYSDKWIKMAEEGKCEFRSGKKASMNFIGFNQHTGGASGLMNNAKIRKALSLAIDRQEFVDLIYGRFTVAGGIIPPGIQVGDEEYREAAKDEPLTDLIKEYNNNNEKLQALFKEGLKEEGVNKELSEIELTYIGTASNTTAKAVLEYYQQSWENKLGIKINMNILADSSLFVTERNENRYDILANGWNGDYSDPMTFMDLWVTGSGYAKFFGGYHSEKYDAEFAKLAGEMDDAKRIEIYNELERIVVEEEAGVAPIYYGDTQIFVQNYVQGLCTTMFGPEYEFSRAYITQK